MKLINNFRFIIVFIILILCNVYLYKNILVPLKNDVEAFKQPFAANVQNRMETQVSYDENILSQLEPDKIVYKQYSKDGSPPITLFMACYNSFDKAGLSHSPIVCFTGQGWKIIKTGTQIIPVDFAGTKSIKVNQMIQNKMDKKLITLYWYQSVESTFHNRGRQKIILFFKNLFGKSDHNAFVRLTMEIPENSSMTHEKNEFYSFVKEFYPELRRFFLENE